MRAWSPSVWIARILGVARNDDGFFEEASSKWRPVDSLRDGVFLAGTSHSPQSLDESLAQAEACAHRVFATLSRPEVTLPGMPSDVHDALCARCKVCIELCPVHARDYDPASHRIVVDPLRCRACGLCAAGCPSAAARLTGNSEGQIVPRRHCDKWYYPTGKHQGEEENRAPTMRETEHTRRFDDGASEYLTERYPGRGQCMSRVLELLDLAPCHALLDVGCGPGTQLVALSPVIRSGDGVDPSTEMIKRARSNALDCPNLRFHLGTALSLPDEVGARKMDRIMSNYALHHSSDGEKALAIRNLARLLPPGGLFVLGDLMFSEDPHLHEGQFDFVGYGPGTDNPAKVSALVQMFESAGLVPACHLLNPLVGVIVGRKASAIG